MTLFVVILTIFLICHFSKEAQRKNKELAYKKSIKSNAANQFDIGCKAIKEMGEQYRLLSASKSFKERFRKSPIQDDKMLKSYLCQNFDMPLSNVNEEKWLLATAKACGIGLDDQIMKTIYTQDVWNELSMQISKEFVASWKAKYSPNLTDEDLEFYLGKAIDFKRQMIYNQTSGCYKDYNDSSIVSVIAQQYGMPNEEELRILGRLPYKNINALANDYMRREIQKQGYCPAMIGGLICPDPTPEDKQKGYAAQSYGEQQRDILKKKSELYQKYYSK